MNKRILVLMTGVLCLAALSMMATKKSAAGQTELASDDGMSFDLLYRADVMATVSGGRDSGVTALGNLDAKFDFDFERMMDWQGVTVGLHGIASHGGKPNANHVGSSQGVDNIEVDTNTAKIFQAWIQKQWLDDKISALVGLYDLNSEFYVSHSTWIFLHPSPGIGSELAQTGQNGPSVYPTSSMALRLRYRPTPETYMQGVVLDGVPGDPNNPRGTHIQFNKGDGTLRVIEAGYVPAKTSEMAEFGLPPTDKYAIGA